MGFKMERGPACPGGRLRRGVGRLTPSTPGDQRRGGGGLPRQTPPQKIMGHVAIYLDRNFDSPGVAHYSGPVSCLRQEIGLKEVGQFFGRSFRTGRGGPLSGPWPSQDPGLLLGGFMVARNTPDFLVHRKKRWATTDF